MSDRQQASIREVTNDEAGRRLDNYLTSVFGGVPRSLVYRVIRSGEVRVNGRRAKASQRLAAGDKVRVPPHSAPDSTAPIIGRAIKDAVEQSVLFEDEHLMVVSKPSGMAVHAGSGLPFGVIDVARAIRPSCPKLELVHRLDRETSGCLMLAKDGATLRALHQQLRAGTMSKAYLALLAGELPEGSITCTAPLLMAPDGQGERRAEVSPEGLHAQTGFCGETWFADWTLAKVSLATGRTHQIRAHAAHLGYPVAADTRYGQPIQNEKARQIGLKRLFLHAHTLTFEHVNRPMTVVAPLPIDLARVLDTLSATIPAPKIEPAQPSAKRRTQS